MTTGDYDLSPDPVDVLRRVESLTGLHGGTVFVAVREGGRLPTRGPATPFESRLRVEDGTPSWDPAISGSVGGQNSLVLTVLDDPQPSSVEQTLAHEYVHVVQAERWSLRSLPKAVLEGTAVYVTDEYTEQFLPNESPSLEHYRQAVYDESVGLGWRLHFAKYYFGEQYVEQVVDDPSEIDEVLADPPETTEQLLHPRTRGNESAGNLSVERGETNGSVSMEAGPRKGELFVRTLLLGELNRSRARTASTGWDADRVVRVRNDSATAFVWTTRWDTRRDAREFLRAIRSYFSADSAYGTAGKQYRVTRTGPRSVTVVVGDETTTEAVTVSTAGTNVTVDTSTE